MASGRTGLKTKPRRRPAAEPAEAGRSGGTGRRGPDDDRPIDLERLPQAIGYALRRAQLAVFQDFIRSLAPVDIRPAQFAVLTVIAANPGLRQSQVSDALGIKRANFVAMLDELERRGLAQRTRVPADRRAYALHLTAAGKSLVTQMNQLHCEHEQRLAEPLGANGKRQLLALLSQLCEPLA